MHSLSSVHVMQHIANNDGCTPSWILGGAMDLMVECMCMCVHVFE